MDDKETQTKEEIKPEAEEEEKPTEEATGDKKTIETLDRADEIVSRRERVAAREEALQDRKEALTARKAVGGEAEGGQETPKPKKLTDTEYAEALERGEVNPLKDDGFLK